MQIEVVNNSKLRIFLTLEDLQTRGIHKEDLWREAAKARQLFQDLMDQARAQFGFDTTGPLVVEVFAIPAQGMLVVVTRGTPYHMLEKLLEDIEEEEDEEVEEVEQIEEEETRSYRVSKFFHQVDTIVFSFSDFEHLVAAAKRVGPLYTDGGQLYRHNGCWILMVDYDDRRDDFIANLAEFGDRYTVSTHLVREYGHPVMERNALHIVRTTF